MRHQNSVMYGVLKQVPWAAFDRLVDAHEADKAPPHNNCYERRGLIV